MQFLKLSKLLSMSAGLISQGLSWINADQRIDESGIVVDVKIDLFDKLQESSKLVPLELVESYVRSLNYTGRLQHLSPEMVMDLINLESYRVTVDDKVMLRNDLTGKFLGIGQFNSATWKSVMTNDFKKNAIIPQQSIKAIIELLLANYQTSFNQGVLNEYPWSAGLAYLYHNQGASAAKSYLQTGKLRYPKQSKKALALFEEVRNSHVSEVA